MCAQSTQQLAYAVLGFFVGFGTQAIGQSLVYEGAPLKMEFAKDFKERVKEERLNKVLVLLFCPTPPCC